ncbi:MAG: hypothetical protein A3F18_02795 [Legionellales bacterium RIFCSPHIGHO2_12_FULL_37_14]|nr:MAG: hypothetical protein A3F18_02795 [Legionellales bacterium RIFCSPHIGHO2_12_FULL_37_14]
MTSSALVSVILLTYNRADWLQVAIESTLAQTYAHFELLILDNCSTDHTSEVVAKFHDPRIRYIRHHCNIGHSANWAYGVHLARGEYLSFLCDDDFYRQDFLYARMQAFDKYKDIQAVFSNFEYCDERGQVTSESPPPFDMEQVICRRALLACVARNLWFVGATLFKRELILQCWEDSMRAGRAGDTALKVHIALDAHNRVAWIKDKGLVMRCHPNQDSMIGGKAVLLGHVAAFHEPLMFGTYTWHDKRLLRRGAARAYAVLRKMAWEDGDIGVARRCLIRQLTAFPYLPSIYFTVSKIKRCFLERKA